MTSGADLKEIVRQIFEARAEGDLDQLMSFIGDNCVFRIAGSPELTPLTDPVVGPAALRATMRHFIDTWEMKALEIVDICVEGNVALVHRKGQMRYGTTHFNTEVMDKMTFDNGKLVECVEFIDTLQAASLLNIATISAAQR
ncbi:nuclear transport factor 2 family protein [Rhizobium cauense]|uniref:nuclear transport factor 2 family protein n=1 Tax=Rhizobium cauense TaxID=1166683 RepID=UPI001C6E807D|nr:nuclear transport factor 2 family protein [Rhizobium cauense]MBW9113228.1 nuclear transport factor 2 family protein [Rhizobium cauense]